MLGGDDGVQFPDGVLHRVVDDEIIVGVGRLELHLGPQQALLHLVGIIGAPVLQPALQFLPAGGRNKNAHGVRPLAGHLDGALDLNVQNHILALFHGLVHKALGGAVEIAHVLRVLQKLVHGDPLAEGIHVHEMVVDAVQLTGPGRPGGGGHGKIQVLPLFQQGLEHRALAHAGRSGNNKCLSLHHISFSCSFGLNRSGGSADKITWSLSIMKMDAVLRP